jgi:hypothetical protein
LFEVSTPTRPCSVIFPAGNAGPSSPPPRATGIQSLVSTSAARHSTSSLSPDFSEVFHLFVGLTGLTKVRRRTGGGVHHDRCQSGHLRTLFPDQSTCRPGARNADNYQDQ